MYFVSEIFPFTFIFCLSDGSGVYYSFQLVKHVQGNELMEMKEVIWLIERKTSIFFRSALMN